MAALSLEDLYAQHIKPRPAAERLRLLEMTAHDLAQTPSTDVDNEQKHSIMEFHGLGQTTQAASNDNSRHSLLALEGLGAEIWEGIDAQEFVNKLRSEWDHRP